MTSEKCKVLVVSVLLDRKFKNTGLRNGPGLYTYLSKWSFAVLTCCSTFSHRVLSVSIPYIHKLQLISDKFSKLG